MANRLRFFKENVGEIKFWLGGVHLERVVRLPGWPPDQVQVVPSFCISLVLLAYNEFTMQVCG